MEERPVLSRHLNQHLNPNLNQTPQPQPAPQPKPQPAPQPVSQTKPGPIPKSDTEINSMTVQEFYYHVELNHQIWMIYLKGLL